MKNFEKKQCWKMKKGNYKQAFAYFATLAEKDDWESMYNEVTKLYKEEATVAKRGEEAIFWLEKCVEKLQRQLEYFADRISIGQYLCKGNWCQKES